jgi:dihydrolipoamide dehydrogenase
LKKNKVQTIWGEARPTAPGRPSAAKPVGRSSRPRPDEPAGAGDYTADHIVIATGTRPRILFGLEPPKRMPESVFVIGSGAIGIEFESFYSGLGSKVTVVGVLLQILAAEDEEITRFARTRFEKQGIAIRTRATVTSAKRAPDGVHRSRRGEKAAKVERTSARPPTGPARRHRRPAVHRQEKWSAPCREDGGGALLVRSRGRTLAV